MSDQHDLWFRRQVEAGLDSANAGHLIPDDEIEAEAQAWREEMRVRMAAGE